MSEDNDKITYADVWYELAQGVSFAIVILALCVGLGYCNQSNKIATTTKIDSGGVAP